jgi:hypothetical protein
VDEEFREAKEAMDDKAQDENYVDLIFFYQACHPLGICTQRDHC